MVKKMLHQEEFGRLQIPTYIINQSHCDIRTPYCGPRRTLSCTVRFNNASWAFVETAVRPKMSRDADADGSYEERLVYAARFSFDKVYN